MEHGARSHLGDHHVNRGGGGRAVRDVRAKLADAVNPIQGPTDCPERGDS